MASVQWKILSDPSIIPRFEHSVAVIHGASGDVDKVFLIGGAGMPSHEALLDVWALDQDQTNWSVVKATGIPGPPKARCGHACAVVGSSVFVFGGYSEEHLDDLLELDTDRMVWTIPELQGSPAAPRTSHTMTAVGERLYVIGGGGPAGAFNDVAILDVAKSCWIVPTVLGTPPTPRLGHSAVLVGPPGPSTGDSADGAGTTCEDRILVFGGDRHEVVDGAETWALQDDVHFLEVDTPYVREQRAVLGGDVVVWSRGEVSQSGPLKEAKPVVICGPSGVGKGTLITKLMEEFPDKLGFSVSHTTRAPRPGEVDGQHYHFAVKAEMENEIAEGKFLETANVHGNLYGTSIRAVEDVAKSGKMCVLDIDVQGARQVRKSPLRALYIFVLPPSMEVLEARLRGRGTENEAAVQKRLANARAEVEAGSDPALFDHRLVNDNLEECYAKLKQLVGLAEESSRTGAGEALLAELGKPPSLKLLRLKTKKDIAAPEVLAPKPRSGHTAVVLGSQMVVYGGASAGGKPLGDIHVLDVAGLVGGGAEPTRGLQWLPIKVNTGGGEAPTERFNHEMVAVSKKDAIVVGGYDGTQAKGDTAKLSVSY